MKETSRYLATFSITTLIFIAGILLGRFLAEKEAEKILTTQEKLRIDLLALDLQTQLASEYICEIDVFEVTKEKFELGRRVEALERELGKTDGRVISLKNQYTLYSIRQFLLMKDFVKRCDPNLTLILFFYSNVENKSASEAQGYILDYFSLKYPKAISVYVFDTDLDNPALNTLKQIYQVKTIPTLVVNERKYEGLQTREDLQQILCNQSLVFCS